MSDPLKIATAKQFPTLNGLSDQQITNIAISSSLYRLFHKAGYSDPWIAADVLAWQRLQRQIIIALPVAVTAIWSVAFMQWLLGSIAEWCMRFTPTDYPTSCAIPLAQRSGAPTS
jgi:hypothetical protein